VAVAVALARAAAAAGAVGLQLEAEGTGLAFAWHRTAARPLGSALLLLLLLLPPVLLAATGAFVRDFLPAISRSLTRSQSRIFRRCPPGEVSPAMQFMALKMGARDTPTAWPYFTVVSFKLSGSRAKSCETRISGSLSRHPGASCMPRYPCSTWRFTWSPPHAGGRRAPRVRADRTPPARPRTRGRPATPRRGRPERRASVGSRLPY
jgi:hypothetical protein